MPNSTPLARFNRTKVASAIRTSLPLLVMGAAAIDHRAYADQTADADSNDDEVDSILEEVVVTGFRGTLQTSQSLKQDSNVVVDSITAEDIGALPDRSVTEALQRVPGVAIHRFAASRDPDHFSVEGAGLVVRGLTYVKSEINGRESFTANNGRGLSFSDIAPELLAGVDVYKSLSADRLEGGIAGTVNLRTRKAFDSQENILAFTAQGTYSDFVEETTPSVSALGTYRWNTNAGEFGVLGSVVYSQTKSRGDRLQVSNFAERTLYDNGDVVETEGAQPVKDVFFPRGAAMGSQEFDKERYGFAGSLQWRSNDDSMEATAEFLRSDSREAWTEKTIEIATDNVSSNGDSRARPGTGFTFDSSDVFETGYITGPSGWRDDQWSGDPRTPVNGLQSNNIARAVDQKFVTDDYSLNFKWYATENLALNFDYQHVKSTVANLDATIWTSTFQDLRLDLNGDNYPFVEFTQPVICDGPPSNECPTYLRSGNNTFVDPYNSYHRSAMDHIEDSDGTLDSFRIDASLLFPDSDFIDSVEFGYRYGDRDQTARFSTYNWGVLSEIWGEGGPVWLDEPLDGNGGQPFDTYSPFYFDNFFDGKVANPLGGDGRLFYNGDITGDYEAYANTGKTVLDQWRPGNGWQPLAERPGVIAGTPFLPNEINPVREKNHAFYGKLDFFHEMSNGWELTGNIGLRYTETNRVARGLQVFEFQNYSTEEECMAPLPPGQERTPFCSLDPSVRQEARDFSNGATTPIDAELDYDYWLPNINVLMRVSDEWQFRASYFEGVAPPDFGLTRAYFPINLETDQEDIEAGNGRPISRFNSGNPLLTPVESSNFDITAEWYFADVGQLTLALFYKDLKKIRTNDIQRTAFTNNGATFDAIVTTAVNSQETGKIKGFELAYQQVFNFVDGPLGGFGVSANYTYVDSSNVPQSTLSETDPDVSAGDQSTVDVSLLGLENLSKHTINLQPFWEYGDWSVRLAYSWRDDFVLTIRDVIVPFQPITQAASGQLDGSVFWQLGDNFKIGLQATNLTGEVVHTRAVISDDLLEAPRGWFMSDTRYTFSLRGTF